jgi:hypothetical protein
MKNECYKYVNGIMLSKQEKNCYLICNDGEEKNEFNYNIDVFIILYLFSNYYLLVYIWRNEKKRECVCWIIFYYILFFIIDT